MLNKPLIIQGNPMVFDLESLEKKHGLPMRWVCSSPFSGTTQLSNQSAKKYVLAGQCTRVPYIYIICRDTVNINIGVSYTHRNENICAYPYLCQKNELL